MPCWPGCSPAFGVYAYAQAGESGPTKKERVFFFFPELLRKTLLELMAMFLSGQCYHYISSVRFVFLPQIYEFINKGDQQEAGQWRRWGVFYL